MLGMWCADDGISVDVAVVDVVAVVVVAAVVVVVDDVGSMIHDFLATVEVVPGRL